MRFGVMGTITHVVVVGGDEDVLHAHARARLKELDRRWSGAWSRSEVAQLNRRDDRLTMVSPETFALVEHAVDAWWRTAGRYDPTGTGSGCQGVRLWPLVEGVTVPRGVELDLAAIGRGYAADLLAVELVERGADGACVNVGGAVRCVGTPPSDDGWALGVRSPRDEAGAHVVRREVAHILLQDGAVSTERFAAGGPWAAATVVAREAWQASVVAHALSSLEGDDATSLLAAWSATALLFTPDGELVSPPGLEAANA
jgi:thiamine biosynthesis lipoprotein ApbE